ncbi:MAG: hypothetical protein JJT87_02775 [Halomonas sp.]|nr:hypothetical protein [Halomonas sp.]MCC5900841.1 hypothetical protein [Halomonas sp.]
MQRLNSQFSSSLNARYYGLDASLNLSPSKPGHSKLGYSTPSHLKSGLPSSGSHHITQLRHWASSTPLSTALWQPNHGQWRRWRWIDLLREAENLAANMRHHGLATNARVGFCGTLNADLLFAMLAAYISHCRTVLIDSELLNEPANFLAACHQQQLLYVVTTRPVSPFNTPPPSTTGCCFLSRQTAFKAFKQLPLALASPTLCQKSPSRLSLHLFAPRGFWAEEGTESPDAADHILSHWLTSGEALVLPENRHTAIKDRRAALITTIIGSPSLHQHIYSQSQQYFTSLSPRQQALYRWSSQQDAPAITNAAKKIISRLMGWNYLQHLEKQFPSP